MKAGRQTQKIGVPSRKNGEEVTCNQISTWTGNREIKKINQNPEKRARKPSCHINNNVKHVWQ